MKETLFTTASITSDRVGDASSSRAAKPLLAVGSKEKYVTENDSCNNTTLSLTICAVSQPLLAITTRMITAYCLYCFKIITYSLSL